MDIAPFIPPSSGVAVPKTTDVPNQPNGWPYRYLPTGAIGGRWSAGADQQLRAGPFILNGTIPLVTAIVGYIHDVGTVGAKIRYGLYQDNGSGLPGALLFDSGQQDATVLGYMEILTGGIQLVSGQYWIAAVGQGAPATPANIYCLNDNQNGSNLLPAVAIEGNNPGAAAFIFADGIYKNGVAGALPNPFGTPTGVHGINGNPGVMLRFG